MPYDLTAFEAAGTSVPPPLPAPRVEQIDLFAAPATELPNPLDMIGQGALVVHNNSGGKDSQALLIHLVERLHVPPGQIVSIHADLGPSEWERTEDHAREIADAYAVPFLVTRATDKTGTLKTFLTMADKRGMFPDRANRSCTSDLKRGPIRRALNAWLRENPQSTPYVLNTLGLRAEESVDRAKGALFAFSPDASCPNAPWPDAGIRKTSATRRLVFNWNPIHHLTEPQVFATIAAAGQSPHWAYSVGARRLSCTTCIFSSEDDIRIACQHSAKARAYTREIIAIEQSHDHTILPLRSGQKRYLADIIGANP